VRAVHAGHLVRDAVWIRGGRLQLADQKISLGSIRRLVVVGTGKAGADMARSLERALGPRLIREKNVAGWVNVPDDQVAALRRIRLHGARTNHDNTPTRAGATGSARMLELIASLGSEDLVIGLISGGGSALCPAPAGRVTLADKQRLTRLLHASGATINEMNAVRKHLSLIKGGGLARATRARVVSLIVSDVVGDPLDVIASGPTAPDPTTYREALAVLKRYGLLTAAPKRTVEHLRRGAAGHFPETMKRATPRVTNHVIGNNARAAAAAAVKARALGYRVVHLSSSLEGESRELGVTLAGLARGARDENVPAAPPVCLLSGGETTVTLGCRPGKGGRNQELVLGALAHLWDDGMGGITILSGGTDGEDGPTDAAGALANAAVLRKARAKKLSPREYLIRHDTYRFFDRAGGLGASSLVSAPQ
jgi:hydroxypyruvate reductase/glycerate 2-kinase